MAALKCFDYGPQHYLPRVACYFDDIVDEITGGLAAIRAFNDKNATRKIAQDLKLRYQRPAPRYWNQQIYYFHDFDHPQYNAPLAQEKGMTELPLF